MENISKPTVFVIMPFREDFLALYSALKAEFKADFEFTNAGDLDNQQNILQDIVEGICYASVIIADLTGLNPNVFYELGLAHALNKKVIILTQDISDLPFDIKAYRAVEYSPSFYKFPNLLTELRKLLAGAMDGSTNYGNPILDYAPNSYRERNPSFEPDSPPVSPTEDTEITATAIDTNEGEKGFLDFIADIEENTSNLTDEINSMHNEMLEMNTSIQSGTSEIGRVKAQSGNADATFVRNVCRKLSVPVDQFSLKLRVHIEKIRDCWSIVECSYLDLLDNRHMQKAENIQSLKGSIASLKGMQTAIYTSNEKLENLITVLRGTMGIERRLNKAITSLIAEFEAYLSSADTISSSIDRIISKSDIVISNIELE